MSKVPSVWITRPQPGNARTSEFLASAGVPVIPVPVLEVEILLPARFDPEPGPDWIVFVSGNAVAGMDRLWETFPGVSRSQVRGAAVGKRTAEAAASRGWNVTVVPGTETAEGLLQSMSGENLTGQTVWIPAGNREGSARESLPHGLRAMGARVQVIPVYATRIRIPAEAEMRLLERAEPGAVVLHSPSSAEAVFSKDAPAAFHPWRRALVICIGPVTLARVRELGVRRWQECREPSDAAVLDVLRTVETLGLERKIP